MLVHSKQVCFCTLELHVPCDSINLPPTHLHNVASGRSFTNSRIPVPFSIFLSIKLSFKVFSDNFSHKYAESPSMPTSRNIL